jgi:hypothetical protein
MEYLLRDSYVAAKEATTSTYAASRPNKVVLLMRHSVRFPIVNPADTYVVTLTEEGVRLAEELGALLAKRFLPGRLRSSPVGRCRATAEAIARGAGWTVKVRADMHLSHPFIEPAWGMLERGEVNGVLPEPVRDTLRWALGGREVARQAYLPLLENRPVLDVLVTHDTIVAVVAGCLLHAPVLGPDYWPGYLEGILLWWAEGQLHARWRGMEGIFSEQFSRIERL